jgi:hypothetical protein
MAFMERGLMSKIQVKLDNISIQTKKYKVLFLRYRRGGWISIS